MTERCEGTTGRPPIPDVPACWSWELPPLPLSNHPFHVTRWQAGRCAICGHQAAELHEDHDHATGDTRGWLCQRCNTTEGRSALPVFSLYRERYPTIMLGQLHRKGRNEHPDVAEGKAALGQAFGDIARLEGKLDFPDDLPDHLAPWRRRMPTWTPLMLAIKRVGLTAAEVRAAEQEQRFVQDSAEVHLPDDSEPTRDRCRDRRWTRPPVAGYGRRPCPDCYRLDPARMTAMVDAAFDWEAGRDAASWRALGSETVGHRWDGVAMSSLFGEPTDKDRARWDIRRQIENLAVSLFGGRRIKRELKSPGVAPLPIDTVEPLAFIRAAVFYRNVADVRAREEAVQARGDGATWAEIAAAAGIVDDLGQDRSAAELAYEWASPRPSMRFDEVNVFWTCGTCGERVKDRGPLAGHPADQEEGHAEGCARHAADIAAWKTATGWE